MKQDTESLGFTYTYSVFKIDIQQGPLYISEGTAGIYYNKIVWENNLEKEQIYV